MTDSTTQDEIQSLREQVEALRRRLPKARLRAGGEADGRDAEGRTYLTIHEVASRLDTTAEAAGNLLARVETRLDLNGLPVVEHGRFEAFLLDAAEGRNTSRFL